MEKPRGTFEYIDRARQLVRFDGIQYGNITPTDIDCCIEYKDKAWIIAEIKGGNKSVPDGQRILLERFISLCKRGNRKGIAIIAEHDINDCRRDIDAKNCIVREYLMTGQARWARPRRAYTLKEMTDAYLMLVS